MIILLALAPSFFKYFVCENISCHFEWTPSTRAGSYTDYFILKVAIVAVASEQLPNEEKFEEVYRGTRTVFVLHPVKYNSKIIATVTSVNYAGESMESERVAVYSANGNFCLLVKNAYSCCCSASKY